MDYKKDPDELLGGLHMAPGGNVPAKVTKARRKTAGRKAGRRHHGAKQQPDSYGQMQAVLQRNKQTRAQQGRAEHVMRRSAEQSPAVAWSLSGVLRRSQQGSHGRATHTPHTRGIVYLDPKPEIHRVDP